MSEAYELVRSGLVDRLRRSIEVGDRAEASAAAEALVRIDAGSDARALLAPAGVRDAVWLIDLADVLVLEGRAQDAVAECEEASRRGALGGPMAAASIRFEYLESEAGAERLHQLAEDGDVDAAGHLARIHQARGEVDRAAWAYRRAVALGESRARMALGLMFAEDGRLEDAERELRAAADADSDAGLELASFLFEFVSFDAAASFLRAEVGRGRPRALLRLATLCKEWGDTSAAIAAYEQAIDSGVVEAYNDLGLLLLDTGDRSAAADVLRRGAIGGDALAATMYGHLLEEDGDIANAETQYRIGISRGDDDAFLDLASVCTASGRLHEAELAHWEAIARGVDNSWLSLACFLGDESNDEAGAAKAFARARECGESDANGNR